MNHRTCVARARAVVHVGIANPRWLGKRSRRSWRMRNAQFYVSDKSTVEGNCQEINQELIID